MEFLYSRNRLNVATSRARCVAVSSRSPALLQAACRTPEQMRLANALCRFVEIAAERQQGTGRAGDDALDAAQPRTNLRSRTLGLV